MAPTKLRKRASRPAKTTQLFGSSSNNFEDNGSEAESDDPMDKDETEERLEKLVFGDDAGFLSALKHHDDGRNQLVLREGSSAEETEEVAEAEDYEGVADADLFFLDSGPTPLPDGTVAPPAGSDSEDEHQRGARPAWVDSDDERIAVSLASHPRLRKLRNTEAEDVVNGKEYIKRLRRQYERLYPAPAWADPSAGRGPKRRKRSDSNSSASSDSARSDISMGSDNEEGTTHPLAKLLQSVADLTRDQPSQSSSGPRKLRSEVIDIQRIKDIPGSQPSSVESLAFHPLHPLLLSSGPASTIYLHHISPSNPFNPNPLVTSLHLKHTPLHTTAFLPSTSLTDAKTSSKIFMSGRRRYFHIWDLETGKIAQTIPTMSSTALKASQKTTERFKLSPCGRYMGLVGSGRKGGGVINVLSASTYQWISAIRIDSRGGIADFEWWSDGEGMAIVGKNGEVSEWDGREKRIVARWMDEGAVGTTVLALGGRFSGRHDSMGGDRWVAIGSSSGVVNVYDRRAWFTNPPSTTDASQPIPRNPKPVRVLDQLTTPTSHLQFSIDGQILVMASRWKRDALRLVHLPSCTVYRNWPTSNTPFGRITSVALSPDGGMLAVGNEQGTIRLWEIHG